VADNEWLARAINEINQAFPRNVNWLVLAGNQRQREENVAEHDRIVDAPRRRRRRYRPRRDAHPT